MTVSVITVCYNCCEELRKTVDSVLSQTFKYYEYLIIDGASTDGTVSLLEDLSSKETSIRWYSEPDKGTYDAMNKGAQKANGDWIIYMNAGDTFYSATALEEFFSTPIADEVAVCYGNTLEIMDYGEVITTREDKIGVNPVMPFIHQSVFVRAEIQRQHPFSQQFRILADYDLFYRLRKENTKFEYRNVVVSRYNARYGISASNPLRLWIEHYRVHELDKKWYWPFVVLKCYVRYGWINPYKRIAPRWFQSWRMKKKMPNLVTR